MEQVAHKLRFADQFYFSRFFKRFNGASPTAYRQRFR
jgi:AraC-like DNA-binding protein